MRQHGGEVKYDHDLIGRRFPARCAPGRDPPRETSASQWLDLGAAAAMRSGTKRCLAKTGLVGTVTLPARVAPRVHTSTISSSFAPRKGTTFAPIFSPRYQRRSAVVRFPSPAALFAAWDIGPRVVSDRRNGRERGAGSLPIYGELSEGQQSWVVEAINNCFRQRA